VVRLPRPLWPVRPQCLWPKIQSDAPPARRLSSPASQRLVRDEIPACSWPARPDSEPFRAIIRVDSKMTADLGTDTASPLSLLGNRLETMKPRTERLPGLRSQLRMAIVGIDGRVQPWASPRHQPRAPIAKVPNNLFQAVNRIRDPPCSFESQMLCNFRNLTPYRRPLPQALARRQDAVDSALFQPCRSHEIGEARIGEKMRIRMQFQ
jgi:hypothetical protein